MAGSYGGRISLDPPTARLVAETSVLTHRNSNHNGKTRVCERVWMSNVLVTTHVCVCVCVCVCDKLMGAVRHLEKQAIVASLYS